MKDSMRTMARPYAILFAIALVVALLARIGLAVMDAAGWLAYDYISASGVPMLDVICSILTGSAFVTFLFAAALTLMVSAAGAVLQAALFAKGVQGAGKPAAAFLWGWAAAAVSLVCLLVVASGILSGVQVGSMSSKLPGAGALVLAAVCVTAILGTLLGAASQVMCACISRAGGRASWNLVGAAATCGAVVMVLTVLTFAAINAASPNMAAVGGLLAVDCVVNVALLLAAGKFTKSGSAGAFAGAQKPLFGVTRASCLRMTGFAMMPPAPFEGEVCVAGA